MNMKYIFTAGYASPSAAIREEFWSHLDSLLSIHNLYFFLLGISMKWCLMLIRKGLGLPLVVTVLADELTKII